MIAAGTDFIVLTGFLGSGKTTLLRDYLALPEAADTAVIVNEAGEIGLDGAILSEGRTLPIALLSNGCVCCSLGSGLEPTVFGMLAERERLAMPPPARIVLETSGLAKPGPTLRSLAGLAPLRLRVGVVATFDCTRGTALEAFEEAAAQWAGAQTLVLTKRDAVSAVALQQARDAAAGLNPTADMVDCDDRRAMLRAAFSLRMQSAPSRTLLQADSVGSHHPRISVVLLRFHEAVPWDDLGDWLDNLAGLCGDRLLRTKGLVRIAGAMQPLLVQSVGSVFSAPRPFAADVEQRSFLVLILRDFDPRGLVEIAPALPMSWTAP